MSTPNDMSIALGLAAIGRRVLCVRSADERQGDLPKAILDELTDRGGEGFGPIRRHSNTLENEHSGGRVTFARPLNVKRREIEGLQFHHIVGDGWLVDEDDRQFALSRCQLEARS